MISVRYFILLLIAFPNVSFAQHIEWASKVVSVSSESKYSSAHAKHILGIPNSQGRETPFTFWAPEKEKRNTGEQITVGFTHPIYVQKILIMESVNPGAIKYIDLIDTRGKRHKVYENKKPGGILEPYRLFKHTIPKTDYKVAQLKLHLSTASVPGYNCIDAIGISDTRRSQKIEINNIIYAEPLQRPIPIRRVNSRDAERVPIISPDGQTLFFARKYNNAANNEEDHDDIWISKKQDDGWSRANNAGPPLNDKSHNFVIAVNPTGNVLYLAGDYTRNQKGVSFSVRKNGKWTVPRGLKIDDFENLDDYVGFHVNVYENVLLMCVERSESLGGRDIYVSFRKKGNQWSKPKNAGPVLNTPAMENNVFIAADNKTIYFTSNGHPGYGGVDIFMSKRLDDTWMNWSTPKNLSDQINTVANDYNFSIPASGDYAYYSTEKNAVGNQSDLFRIPLPPELQPEPVKLISGRIVDAETNQPIAARLLYKKTEDKESSNEIDDLEDGSFQVVVPANENIDIHAEVDGYFAISEALTFADELEEVDMDYNPNTPKFADSETVALKEKLNAVSKELILLESKSVETSLQRTGNDDGVKDDELDNLRSKFNTVSTDNEDKSIDERVLDPDKPEQRPQQEVERNEDDDDELFALRKKFMNAHYLNREDLDPSILKEESAEIEPSGDPVQGLSDAEARVAVKQIETEVRESLKKELIDDVRSELEKELEETVRSDLSNEMQQRVESELKDKLKDDVRSELEKELYTEVWEELTESEKQNVEAQLKKSLADDVRQDLRKELREEVRQNLIRELEYKLKKELEEQLRKELELKYKQNQIVSSPNVKDPVDELEEEDVDPGYEELEKDILVVPIKVGQIIPMNNIFFDANESTLKPESTAELERVVRFLEKYSNLIIEVGGHTNGWCTDTFARELSRARSKAVCDYLKKHGIPSGRIQFHGYGRQRPIATNDTVQGRKKNQRVELKILEILDN